MRTYTRRPEAERFWEKVDKTSTCWLWTAGVTDKGYGAFYVGRRAEGTYRQVPAHRWSYETEHGPIPAGLEVDHLCRVRMCVNPAHLEAVTRRVNQLRGLSVSGLAARRTHCPQGHPYDEANTYRRADTGARVCRTCRSARARRRYARLVAA